jgi:hypothetical protein
MPSSVKPMTATTEPLELDVDERELIGLELAALLPALEGPRREHYQALADTVAGGTVPAELIPQLESLLELVLQTARARKLYRAEGERVLTGLLRRTPRGRELGDHLSAVNKALRALTGHTLNGARVGMRTLGHFTVTLQTDAATLTIAVRPDSLNVESVAVGDGS